MLLDLVLAARTGLVAMRGDTQMTDTCLVTDVVALRESFEDPETNFGLRWLPGAKHIADALAKRGGNSALKEVLTAGRRSLRDTTDVRAERKRVKQLRKRPPRAVARRPPRSSRSQALPAMVLAHSRRTRTLTGSPPASRAA